MGKTSVPLKILLVGMAKGPEMEALEAMGHVVNEANMEYDLIMGPHCYRILPQHMKFLTLALKEARAHAKALKVPKVKKGSHA
jgi:hypothetical protein